MEFFVYAIQPLLLGLKPHLLGFEKTWRTNFPLTLYHANSMRSDRPTDETFSAFSGEIQFKMKEAAILIVLLLGFSQLQMTWAFFLDPFGLFENEAIEQETIVFEDEEITLKDTRTADFNSSFLVVGKSIYSSFEF